MNQISSFRYTKGPVKVSVQKVNEYPHHWHDCLEIVIVLEGSILLERALDDFYFFIPHTMKKNDIFVVSINEIHRIYSNGNDNAVLIIQIDADFIKQNFSDITTLEFISLLNLENDLDKEKIDYSKQLAMNLASLIINYNKDKTEIEKTTKVLLYTLIYNFNRINKAFNQSKSNLKYYRFLSIAEYLIKNAHHKNLLQEIAEHEHLNPAFISHEIKKYFVYGFQDQVNGYRVKKALKMLLATDKNICEIAYECGFSAPRYFYKAFNQRAQISTQSQSPVDFRNTNQKNHQNINYIKCYEELDNVDIYIKPHQSKPIGENIEWLKIDADSLGKSYALNWRNHLNILKSKDLLNPQTQNYLRLIQKEFAFKKIRLYDLFNDDIQAFNPNESDHDWSNVNLILYFINQIGCRPLIKLETTHLNIKLYQESVYLFLKNIKSQFKNEIIKNWAFEIDHNCDPTNELIKIISEYTENIFEKDIIESGYAHSLSNTIYMATYLIKKAIHNDSIDFLQAIDNPNNEEPDKNFSGLITQEGLYKPSYHACSLLTLLGDELVEKGDYYIVTKKKDSLQILLYNHLELGKDIEEDGFYNNYLDNKNYIKKINIFIQNINCPYKVIRYELNNENGSVYYHLRQMASSASLDSYDIKLLNDKISIPRITMDYAIGEDITLNVNLQPYSVELITLNLKSKTF